MARDDEAREMAEDACSTMEAALETLKERPDVSAPLPTKPQLASVLQLLKLEVAKVGLMYNSPSSPTAKEAEALLRGLQNAVCGVCMLLMGVTARGAPTLRGSVHGTAGSLVTACVQLTRGAVEKGMHGDALMHLVGLAIEQCDAAAKAPLDNRTAIGRAITQVLKTLADASRELQELIDEAAEAGGEGSGSDSDESAAPAGPADDGGGEQALDTVEKGAMAGEETKANGAVEAAGSDVEEEDDGELACEALSAAQLRIVRSVHAVVGAVSGLLRAVVRALLAAGEATLEGSGGGPEEWEGLLFHIKALATAAEDLAAAAWPPHDSEELDSAADAVLNGCELIAEETPVEQAAEGEERGSAAEESAQHIRELQQALATVHGAYLQLSEALEADAEE